MWRSKKFIIVAVLAAVLLFGSLGGAVLADNGDGSTDTGDKSQRGACREAMLTEACEILINDWSCSEDITAADLEDILMTARQAIGDECQGPNSPRGPHGPMAQVFESFGADQEAVQAALEQARGELEDGTLEGGRGAVMARVLGILGITEEEWQAACDEAREARQEMWGENLENGPFGTGFGFKGPGRFRGFGSMRGFGGPCAPEFPAE